MRADEEWDARSLIGTARTSRESESTESISSVVTNRVVFIARPGLSKSIGSSFGPECPSIGLEAASNGVTLGAMEKRLLPRLTVTHEVFRDGKTGKLFSVIDLSKNGMAIRYNDRADLDERYMVGGAVGGILNLRREKLPITGRVRHIGKD